MTSASLPITLPRRRQDRRHGLLTDPWAVGVGVLAIAGVLIFLLLPELLVDDRDFSKASDRYMAENDVRTTGIQLLGGLVLVMGAYFTARTFLLNREGQITDRFSKAVDHLGSESAATRLGGVYALERITKSDPGEQGPILETLCAFVREESKRSTDTRSVVQAAVTVIGRRETRFDEPPNVRLDLSGADLRGLSLREGQFARALLADAQLASADLTQADLTDSDLRNAILTKATLRYTVLTGANVTGVRATDAVLDNAARERLAADPPATSPDAR